MDHIYNIFLSHPSISTDSRKVHPGDLFFALKGDNFDGNDYAEKALEMGAAYVVVDRPLEAYVTGPYGAERFIHVPDALETLQQLALHHRRTLKTAVLALTGTNGKTTTKELITAVLSTTYQVCATQGNLNNHIGVPLTLLRMDKHTEIAVVEMGANHPGEIAQLAAITQPDYGLITNVGKAHLEGFSSLEGVMLTKGALYEAAHFLFLNADNPLLCQMASSRAAQKLTHLYGINHQKATILKADEQHPFLRLSVPGYPLIETCLIGDYNAENVLAALKVGALFGIDPHQAATAIQQYKPSNNRSQRMVTEKNVLIVDAYNANPTSMAVALANFESLPAKNKMVILGDMLELGADSELEHQIVVEQVRRLLENGSIKHAFLVGPRFVETQCIASLRYNAPHPNASHPNVSHSDASHPDASHSDASHSNVSHSDASHSDASHSDVSHPDVSHSDASHPDVSHPDASHPDALPGHHGIAETQCIASLRHHLLQSPITGATILIKGSRGMRLEQVLEVL